MANAELKARILEAVEAGWAEQVAFTQDLVRYPSVRGQEHTAQAFLHDELARRGYAMDRWVVREEEIRDHPGFSPIAVPYDNAVNVVGTHTPRQARGRSSWILGRGWDVRCH